MLTRSPFGIPGLAALVIGLATSGQADVALEQARHLAFSGNSFLTPSPTSGRNFEFRETSYVALVGTDLVKLPLVLRSGITLLGEGHRGNTSLIRAADGLPAAIHTPEPVSDHAAHLRRSGCARPVAAD